MSVLTGRFWLLTGCLFGLLLLGLATLQGAVLALAAPLLVYLAAAVLCAPDEPRWQASRTIDLGVVDGKQQVSTRVVLQNGSAAADELFIQDELPPQAEYLSGTTRLLLPLVPGAALEYAYIVRCGRGRQFFRGLTLVHGEHFGLLQRPVSLELPGEIQALPRPAALRPIDIRPPQTRGFSGPIPARQGGSGMSFWGVRAYQIGDPLRRINWKVSAQRLAERGAARPLFANQFEQERIADVGLILDARQQTNPSIAGQSIFEFSVLAASTLAETFLAAGQRVSLLTYGCGLERVYPGCGKVQRQRILRALAEVEIGSNYALESLERLPTRLFPAGSQLVMISPLGARDYPAYMRLRQANYAVLLVSPDPVSFEILAGRQSPRPVGGPAAAGAVGFPGGTSLPGAASLPGVDDSSQAVRLAHLERSLWLRKLTRLGVQVIDWPVDQPIERVIHSALARRPQARRGLPGGVR